jgi:hypothetical protein
LFFKKESIIPFVVFLQGCDFHDTETIGSRVVGIFEGSRKNSINLFKDVFDRAGSYFMRGHKYDEAPYGSSDWTREEMNDIFKNTAEKSLVYYIDKYL